MYAWPLKGGGGGAKRAISPGSPVKEGPKICKRGATKGIIENKFIWNAFYINNGMRKSF